MNSKLQSAFSMRKVIKILAKVLSVIILLSIFLPVAVTLVLNIEDVQNVVVKRASQFASEYLGTKVSIDRIDIDLFSRVRVEGFYVEDHEQDTLLYVSRAKAMIKSLNVPNDGLLIRWAEVEDGFALVGYDGDSEIINIPNTYLNESVVEISENAFCKNGYVSWLKN